MENKSSSFKIKSVAVFVLLFIESILLSISLINYAILGEYIPQVHVILKIALLMLIISYTNALTVGAWGGWEQYFITPVAISGGIFLSVAMINPIHARNIVPFCLLLLFFYNMRTLYHKSIFIRFVPRIAFGTVTRGILFVFSLMCASIIFISTDDLQTIKLQNTIQKTISSQVEKLVKTNISTSNIIDSTALESEIKAQIQKQVIRTIEPYEEAITPLIALLVFSLVQAVGTLVSIIFSISIKWVYSLARKTKFLKQEYRTVQQEHLVF